MFPPPPQSNCFFFLYSKKKKLVNKNFSTLNPTLHSIALGDVRHIRRQPVNELSLGRVGFRQNLPKFNPKFKRLFAGVVFDPSRYLKVGFPVKNLCLIANIILHINLKMGNGLKNITSAQMEADMNMISWGDIITPDANGIPLRKLKDLEEKLNPIPPALIRKYPGLQFLNGICVNVFQLRTTGNHARLFGVSLGGRYQRIRDVLQVDVLIDEQKFRDKTSSPVMPNHCLLIANISLFLQKNQQNISTNRSRNNLLCRGCMKYSHSYNLMKNHFEICGSHNRLAIGRRRTKNILIHEPKRLNKFTGKMEDHGTSFTKANNKLCIQDLSIAVLDYEAAQVPLNIQDQSGCTARSVDGITAKTPLNATTLLPVISVSFAWASNYADTHPLPQDLQAPRFLRVDDKDPQGERNFYVGMLLKIREDLVRHHRWLQSILAQDLGVPPIGQRPLELLNYFESITECQLCGRTFGSKCYSAR